MSTSLKFSPRPGLLLGYLFLCCLPAASAENQKLAPHTRIVTSREADLKTADGIKQKLNPGEVVLITERGRLIARDAGDGLTSVNMGDPQLRWDEVPLAHEMDTLELPIDGAPTATGMGNPHCTFFVEDAESVDLEARGSEIEHHPLYPQRTNVQFASLIGDNHLRMRVWERGSGETLACGTGACAAVVAGVLAGVNERRVTVHLRGGDLEIEWAESGEVYMTGPSTEVFSGEWNP